MRLQQMQNSLAHAVVKPSKSWHTILILLSSLTENHRMYCIQAPLNNLQSPHYHPIFISA